MNKNVLVITEDYNPILSANGVISKNLVSELCRKGYSVSVLCMQKQELCEREKTPSIKLFGVPSIRTTPIYRSERFGRILSKISILTHMCIFPLNSFFLLYRMKKIAKQIIINEGIGLIIAVNNPLEACLTGVAVKRNFPGLLLNIFDVDSFSNVVDGAFLSKETIKKLMWRWEKQIFQYADKVVVMENHSDYYLSDRYSHVANKLDFSSFPSLVISNYDLVSEPLNKKINKKCVHLGTIDVAYRNPEYVCRVFLGLKDVELHFYGKSNASSIMHKYQLNSSNRIEYHGPINFDDGQKQLSSSDFLISIGNSNSDMVPSKIFEYMSFGKPIIHFSAFDKDQCIKYLERYQLALVVNTNTSVEESIHLVEKFIREASEKRVPKQTITEEFYTNLPSYSIEKLT